MTGGWMAGIAVVALGVRHAILVLLLDLQCGSSVPRGLRARIAARSNRYSLMAGMDSIRLRVAYFDITAFETDFSAFGYTGTGKAVTTVYGPAFQNFDMSFTKDTRITERVNFKFSANFFNAFNNHYLINSQGGNYGGPSVAFTTDVSSADFGKWNGAVTTPRTIQFAGRIEF